MPTGTSLPSLKSLEAYIGALKGNPAEALSQLEGFSDPNAVKCRLAIYIEIENFQDAATSIKHLTPHASWIDLAAFVYSRNGDLEDAKRCLEWAISQHQNLLSERT